MNSNLSGRVSKLEHSRGQGCFCLLYTDAWSQERLDAEIARLKRTYSEVIPLLMDEEDLAL